MASFAGLGYRGSRKSRGGSRSIEILYPPAGPLSTSQQESSNETGPYDLGEYVPMPGPKHKKKGRHSTGSSHGQNDGPDTSRPTAVFKPGKPRSHTLSIALPGSIIANCQTHDLKCRLAGTIARAASVFCVDEIVVFDDTPSQRDDDLTAFRQTNGYSGDADPSHFLAHLLSYLETPPHLRKHLFPLHPDLRTAGSLPSLDLPHHLRAHDACRFREGVSVPQSGSASVNGEANGTSSGEGNDGPPAKKAKKKHDPEKSLTAFVDVGFFEPVVIPDALPPWTRLTVEFDDGVGDPNVLQQRQSSVISATPVDPSAPREKGGMYWGYTVRRAGSLSGVFTESPWEGGYDVSVGTSERGMPLESLRSEKPHALRLLQGYKHLLLVFGGVAGLENAVYNDADMQKLGLTPRETQKAFDLYINLVPNQGSRTIRAEEATWIGLAAFKDFVARRGE